MVHIAEHVRLASMACVEQLRYSSLEIVTVRNQVDAHRKVQAVVLLVATFHLQTENIETMRTADGSSRAIAVLPFRFGTHVSI